MKVAVIGAGWAGLAAAVSLRDAGWSVTVFEASHQAGGRARRVPSSDFQAPIDNGQHLLLGAYTDTLALMKRLGCDPERLLLRQPLRLESADGRFALAGKALPGALASLTALATAHGLTPTERWAVLRFMVGLQCRGWRTPPGATVQELLAGQPAAAMQWLWRPLCLAAMNTPMDQACAALFAHVLRDALAGRREASDLLLPRTDLSSLWPDAAARLCDMRYGHPVRQLHIDPHSVRVEGTAYDAVVLAIPPATASRLLAGLANAAPLTHTLDAFTYLPIATLTLQFARPLTLRQPMLMLREDPARGHHGQWLFDRSRLLGLTSSRTEWAVVVSEASALMRMSRTEAMRALTHQIDEQLADYADTHPVKAGGAIAVPVDPQATTAAALTDDLPRLPPASAIDLRAPRILPPLLASELIVEKRATFAATPGLVRPGVTTPWPRLVLAGDWTDTGYPGVLEGAVRSGQAAAQALVETLGGNA